MLKCTTPGVRIQLDVVPALYMDGAIWVLGSKSLGHIIETKETWFPDVNSYIFSGFE